MRTINVTLTDEEFEKVEEKKDKMELTWHDFILELATEEGVEVE